MIWRLISNVAEDHWFSSPVHSIRCHWPTLHNTVCWKKNWSHWRSHQEAGVSLAILWLRSLRSPLPQTLVSESTNWWVDEEEQGWREPRSTFHWRSSPCGWWCAGWSTCWWTTGTCSRLWGMNSSGSMAPLIILRSQSRRLSEFRSRSTLAAALTSFLWFVTWGC